MKSSMPEELLIEEAGDRALDRLHPHLTLVLLAFDSGETEARALATAQAPRIIDPIASACFGEARELLLRPAKSAEQVRAGLFAALFALDIAAEREPECYAATRQVIRAMVLSGLDEAVTVELDNGDPDDEAARDREPERICN